jgi:hypothetical protein
MGSPVPGQAVRSGARLGGRVELLEAAWRLIVMGRILAVLMLLVAVACCGCGSSTFGRECSGGTVVGDSCVPYPAVHWTDARATAAALAFDYSPMVNGKLTQAHCRVVARLPYAEGRALCRGVFVSPGQASSRVVVAFDLNGHGVLNPNCSRHWETSPYCSARGQPVQSGS